MMRRIEKIIRNALGENVDSRKEISPPVNECGDGSEENNDVAGDENGESPAAPLYSPLTPLVKRIWAAESQKETSSPLRPMSPSTLELWNILNDFSDEELRTQSDSDYIADSDNCKSSSDLEDIPRKSVKKIKVSALIHGSKRYKEIDKTNQDTSTNNLVPADVEIDKDIVILNQNIVSNILTENIIKETNINENKTLVTATENKDLVENNDILCEDNNLLRSSNPDVAESSNQTDVLETYKGRPKKGRKRIYEDHTIAERKQRKYANLPYNTKRKLIEPKIFRDYVCQCKRQCFNLITKEDREEEFKKYINLGSYEAQLLFIVKSVSEAPKKRSYTILNKKTDKCNPKKFSRIYTIKNIQVCREMFINNYQITTKKVDESLKKMRSGMINDRRGLTGGWNKTCDEEIDFIKQIINSLPKYISHYNRKSNNDCQYLKLGMTIPQIYNLYIEQHKSVYGESKKPKSINTLKNIYYKYFNLKCKKPKKDTCKKCDSLDVKIKNTTGVARENAISQREEHQKRAENLRNSMKEDLSKAATDQNFECLTFDMEKTLPLPRIPTSIVFYKRQLWLYNCGIHAGSNNTGYCFVWLEGEAGRGSQEVGSCLIYYIKNKLGPKEHLVLWSDCCGGQNRNIKIVLMLKVVLQSHPTLKTITLKYLESGHTFLPNDTDFSKIESHLKYYERIYTAEEYMNVMKSCKKKNPLEVIRMKRENFIGTKDIEKKIVNRKLYSTKEKVNWLNTKEILLKKDNTYTLFMKIAGAENFQELDISKKIKGKPMEILEENLCLLWPDGKDIPQAKLDDLQSMYDLIPKDCLAFYKSLRGNNKIIDDIDGFGAEPDFPLEYDSNDSEDEREGLVDEEV